MTYLKPSRERTESFLLDLVNWRTPEEQDAAAVERLRTITKDYWPDLWEWVDAHSEHDQQRTVETIRKIRWYLRQAWESSNADARNWYVQRAREYHHFYLNHPHTPSALRVDDPQRRALIWQFKQALDELNAADSAEAARQKSSWLNLTREWILDQPPTKAPFNDALLHLLDLADLLKRCRNPQCEAPYFIGNVRGQPRKYCSPECHLLHGKPQSDLDYYHRKGKKLRQAKQKQATERNVRAKTKRSDRKN